MLLASLFSLLASLCLARVWTTNVPDVITSYAISTLHSVGPGQPSSWPSTWEEEVERTSTSASYSWKCGFIGVELTDTVPKDQDGCYTAYQETTVIKTQEQHTSWIMTSPPATPDIPISQTVLITTEKVVTMTNDDASSSSAVLNPLTTSPLVSNSLVPSTEAPAPTQFKHSGVLTVTSTMHLPQLSS
jgi:hypothetical protein